MWGAVARGLGGAIRVATRPVAGASRTAATNGGRVARSEVTEDEPRRALAPVLLAAGSGAVGSALYGDPACEDIGAPRSPDPPSAVMVLVASSTRL